jgi:hypothetical protein
MVIWRRRPLVHSWRAGQGRHAAGRDGGVGEAVDLAEIAVEDLDGAEAEVGGVQELAGRGADQG